MDEIFILKKEISHESRNLKVLVGRYKTTQPVCKLQKAELKGYLAHLTHF